MTHPAIIGYANAVSRRGAKVTLRQLSTLPGPEPLLNPPTLQAPVADGDQATGATTLQLRAGTASGRLVAGDKITLAGQTFLVGSDTSARGIVPIPGFDAIPVTPAVASTIPDGTPATVAYAADLDCFAMIDSYPQRVVDGDRIRSRDLQVTLPAFGLPVRIQTTWRLLFGDNELAILDVFPTYIRSEVARWDIHAR